MIRRTDDPAEKLADELLNQFFMTHKFRLDAAGTLHKKRLLITAAIRRHYPATKAKRPKKMSRKKMDNPYRGVFDFTSIGEKPPKRKRRK